MSNNKAGQPRKFTDSDELYNKIIEFFKFCDTQKREYYDNKGVLHIRTKPYTLSGLCLYLDICGDTFAEYAKGTYDGEASNHKFSDACKHARKTVENFVEEGILNGDVNPVAGIFNLKNNFGWKDRQDIDISSEKGFNVEITIIDK
jgi:hypothetical protein